ncbi:hypothetical protein HELRODRAFT_63549, partial [Helobdella robusta]|uniref:5'-AMP-activated protein kinase subunit beta-1 n=1 Tax=Helobdella robusta TaxID=6412 RepID=T1FXH3_HELRO
VFKWKGQGDKVFLSGSYDNWSTKLPLVRSGSEFFTIKELPQGTHEYRYLVDNEWVVHKNEPIVDGKIGGQCNVVTVNRTDCDIFAALSADDIRSTGVVPLCTNSGWTQDVPPRGTGYTFMRSGPPLLPPHLSNTILNLETPPQCDPTILVQPTHVVLNHLYTLSIKDGVLVLGTTYRYRKKYVTAVLYKPI